MFMSYRQDIMDTKEMNKRLKAWMFPVVFTGYVLASVILLFCLNFHLPMAVEKVIYVLITPCVFIFGLFQPVLKSLGWVEGEMIQFPSVLGLLVVLIVCNGVFYLVGICFSKLQKKNR